MSGIWSLILESGRTTKFIPKSPLTITSVSLDRLVRESGGESWVLIHYQARDGEQSTATLCCLTDGKANHSQLCITLPAGSEYEIEVVGKNCIHFTGHYATGPTCNQTTLSHQTTQPNLTTFPPQIKLPTATIAQPACSSVDQSIQQAQAPAGIPSISNQSCSIAMVSQSNDIESRPSSIPDSTTTSDTPLGMMEPITDSEPVTALPPQRALPSSERTTETVSQNSKPPKGTNPDLTMRNILPKGERRTRTRTSRALGIGGMDSSA